MKYRLKCDFYDGTEHKAGDVVELSEVHAAQLGDLAEPVEDVKRRGRPPATKPPTTKPPTDEPPGTGVPAGEVKP